MPWIDKNECIGCEICVKKCPIGAISMQDEKAQIDMIECIRCGTCHDVCSQGAVRHDSERIPEEIEANVKMTKSFMDACVKYLGEPKEGQKCLNRMMKHFNKEKIVVEKTLEELKKLKNN